MKIAVDFDGTCVLHKYPKVGNEVEGAVDVLKALVNKGHKIILYTMRSGKELDEAIRWFEERDIELYGINEDPEQRDWTESPKAYANMYIDDSAFGAPLLANEDNDVFLNWKIVENTFKKYNII